MQGHSSESRPQAKMSSKQGKRRPSGRASGSARQRLRDRQEKGKRGRGKREEPREPQEVKATSSFPAPAPSRASVESMIIQSNKGKESAPIFWSGLLGMIGMFGLIVFDGLGSQFALSYVVLLSGLWAIFRPPAFGLSRAVDVFALALVFFPIVSFLPQFYWPDADWRRLVEETSGIELPMSLAVEAWSSFEIWVQIVAALTWFYVASSWPLNYTGRKWLCFGFSVFLATLSGAIIWGLTQGGSIIGSFHILQDEALNTAILSSGAALSFVFVMGNHRGRDLAPFVGVLGMGAALGALHASGSGLGLLLFLVGVMTWYVLKLRSGGIPRFFKLFLPILALVLGFLIVENESLEIPPSGVYTNAAGERATRTVSALKMFLDAPLTGVGLGNFDVVLPQYERVISIEEPVVHPVSDLVWLGAEGGLLGLTIVLGFFAAYASLYRNPRGSSAGATRLPARVALLVFLLAAVIDTPAHNTGAIFFGLFLMVLALPRMKSRKGFKFPRLLWRLSGGLLVMLGLVWLVAVTLQLPLTTSVAQKHYVSKLEEAKDEEAYSRVLDLMDRWTIKNPLDEEAYFAKAAFILEQGEDQEEAAASFDMAYASAPFSGAIPLRAGVLWASHDIERAIAAWSRALSIGLHFPEEAVSRMVRSASGNTRLRRRLAELTDENPSFVSLFLQKMEGRELRREVEEVLRADPGLALLSREDRTAVVMNWVNQGGGSQAEAFLNGWGDSIDNEWLARSVIAKDRADFAGAVDLIRSNLEKPNLPGGGLKITNLVRAQREFAVNRTDLAKGGSLLRYYVDSGEYRSASRIAEQLAENSNAPISILYWKAEVHYRLEDYIESWFTFQQYIEQGGLADQVSKKRTTRPGCSAVSEMVPKGRFELPTKGL